MGAGDIAAPGQWPGPTMAGAEKFIWCLVANVMARPRAAGDGAGRAGTRHFAPGAKLFCFPFIRGDGGGRIRVLGRHRDGGPRLLDMVVASRDLENWRAQKVYRPDVVAMMIDAWDDSDSRRELAEELAAMFGRVPAARSSDQGDGRLNTDSRSEAADSSDPPTIPG